MNLRIRRGEIVALVGRNGSGKTTLAKHLNGLLAPTSGAVVVEGRRVDALPLEEMARHVGYVFQDPDHQLFAATVGEEVAFGPQNLGLPADDVGARVAAALQAVGLDDRDADPFLLDKGFRQRLAVAAVLALGPDVLVLDEPTTGLDLVARHDFMERVRQIARDGTTLILISHHVDEIVPEIERVVLLREGRIAATGPKRLVLTRRALSDLFNAPISLDEHDGYFYALLERAASLGEVTIVVHTENIELVSRCLIVVALHQQRQNPDFVRGELIVGLLGRTNLAK